MKSILLAVVASVLLGSCATIPVKPQVGFRAPTFRCRDIDGVSFNSGHNSGRKSRLLFFWSVFCQPSRQQRPILANIAKRYSGRRFEILAVNIDGEEFINPIRTLLEAEGSFGRILFDTFDDGHFDIADPYGVDGTPTMFLVDRNGIITWKHLGAVSEDLLVDWIDRTLAR